MLNTVGIPIYTSVSFCDQIFDHRRLFSVVNPSKSTYTSYKRVILETDYQRKCCSALPFKMCKNDCKTKTLNYI